MFAYHSKFQLKLTNPSLLGMNNLPAGPTRLPTDQEIGITPGTIVSDPNFNVGSHPGEIYVDDTKKKSQTSPPRRFYNEYSKAWPYNQYYPYKSVRSISFNEFLLE